MDKRFSRVRTHIAEMRRQLKDKYDQCQSHLDEATTPTSSTMAADKKTDSAATEDDRLEPTEEFMRKKRQESDAHLMMFWDYR